MPHCRTKTPSAIPSICDTPLSAIIEAKSVINSTAGPVIRTSPLPSFIYGSTKHLISSQRCPYNIMAMRRNEAQKPDFPEILDLCLGWALEDLKNGNRLKDPVSFSQIDWAYNILKNDETRHAHESSARANKCSCMSAWEKLLDEEQAFLIKHQDECHRVPEASDPNYDHSRDYQIHDTDPSTWNTGFNLELHHGFVQAYQTIWQIYDEAREDDDLPQACIHGGPCFPYHCC